LGSPEEEPVSGDLVNTPALFRVGIRGILENNSVTRLRPVRGVEIRRVDPHGRPGDRDESAHECAALLSVSPLDQLLVVHSVQPAAEKAAREGHFKAVMIFCADRRNLLAQRGVDRLTINSGHRGHVFRRLEPPFDLEAADAQPHQLGNLTDCRKVLRRKQVALLAQVPDFAVDDDLIRHPARLGAFAPIGTASAKGFAGQTLPRIGDAECPMDEDFKRKFRPELRQIAQGELAGNNDLFCTEFFGKRDSLGRGDGHLGGDMNRQRRKEAPDTSAMPTSWTMTASIPKLFSSRNSSTTSSSSSVKTRTFRATCLSLHGCEGNPRHRAVPPRGNFLRASGL
jgi:hypothetical protein